MKKSLCSLLRLIFKSIKKNKETGSPQCKGSNGKAEETKNTHDKKNQNLKKLFAPGTYSEKSVQDNKKKITNKYEEMIKNDKKLIAKPEGASIIKPMELRLNHVLRCFGITKSPGDDIEITKWLKDKDSRYKPNPNSYIMVMAWANDGNLLNYIENKAHDEKFTWYKRLEMLEVLSDALERIHSKNMVHKNLHCGNVLMDNKDIFQFPAICASELRNIFLEWKKHYHSNNSEFLIAEEARLNRIKNPDLFDDVLSL
ncbi:17406_t:CDS:2 [Rhizophagus irregularis]|nr:17406_t:CDS:2 [Rhizophagus irregularis]